MSLPIIDMRSRPSFLHDFYGATPGTPSFDVVRWLNGRVGSRDVDHFRRSVDVDAFIGEIREAGIAQAVVVGRDTPGVRHTNDEIHALVKGRPELVGLGSVDIDALTPEDVYAEVRRAVTTLGLKAINLEPGWLSPARAVDHPSLFPAYEACLAAGVPVCLMSGPTAPDLDLVRPAAVGRVARAFPGLKIVCYHGFYPFAGEMIGVALRHENVHVVADMYIFLPGGGLYVEAANGFMGDQLLFGSSYPFRPMRQSVDDYLALGFREDVIDQVMHRNATRLLALGAEGRMSSSVGEAGDRSMPPAS
jgi:predicted TIM-barrel fold metal-dependent hydrolase